jgi:hypothetical protein
MMGKSNGHLEEGGKGVSSLMNKLYINSICPGKSNLTVKLDFQDLL